ncbi:MAG: phospholipase D-like domain-containing protein [Gammaproteobacteria bacterium]
MKKLIVILLICFSSIAFAEQSLIIEPNMGRTPLLNAINNAQYSIDLVIYGFTDKTLEDALINAHKRGVIVNVILQNHPYKAHSENLPAYFHLRKNGVNVRWSNPEYNLTHQKTMLVDDKDAYIMTFNFTYDTFKSERNFAYKTEDTDTTQNIKNVFDDDWLHQKTYPKGEALVWSPNNSESKLLSLINHAQNYIDVYAQSISDYRFIGDLERAARRGVDVTVLLPKKALAKEKNTLAYLCDNGVHVYLSNAYYIHAKGLLIDFPSDSQKAYIGSTNFTYTGLHNNRELGIIFTDFVAMQNFKHTFLSDLKMSDEFSQSTSR